MSGLVINPYTFVSAAVEEPLVCTFYESRYGAGMGDVDVYVVDTSGNIIGSSIYSASGDDGLTGAWAQRTTSTPNVSGTFRIAWNYRQTNAVFRGDYAVDTIEVMGFSFNFDTDNNGFTTSTVNTTDSATAFSSATSVLTQTTAQTAVWNRTTGATPSTNTGPTGAQSGTHYVYCETSAPNNVTGMNFWLFSPEITV